MELTVEDIMSDQGIISSEINITMDSGNDGYWVIPYKKLWLHNVLHSLRNQLVPALTAFLVNSVARPLAPLQAIPLSFPVRLEYIRARRRSRAQLALMNVPETDRIEECQDAETSDNDRPEKCVNCTILHQPEGEPSADIIFVHGLHGGVDRTWTQGTWRLNNHKLKDQTPVRRRSTGNMYVPVKDDNGTQEGTLKRTLSKIYSKVPIKVARKNGKDYDQTDRSKEMEEVDKEVMENFSQCWPRDWLPQDCPGVRVVAINYTTDMLWRPMWQKMKTRSDLRERSKEMIEELVRVGVGRRPIVWVGHSKGGLFIKQIILNATSGDDEFQHIEDFFNQTKAIMFYSVPHKGSPIADMIFPFFKRSIELLEVQRNCKFVLDLHQRFLEIFNNDNNNKPEIFSFIDTENTPVAFTSLKFIAYESADPDIGTKCDVPLNHREICKPAGRDCFLYLELVKLINRSIFNKNK